MLPGRFSYEIFRIKISPKKRLPYAQEAYMRMLSGPWASRGILAFRQHVLQPVLVSVLLFVVIAAIVYLTFVGLYGDCCRSIRRETVARLHLSPRSSAGADLPWPNARSSEKTKESGSVVKTVTEFDVSKLDRKSQANMPSCDGEIDLMVIVASDPKHFHRRQSIRASWGRSSYKITLDARNWTRNTGERSSEPNREFLPATLLGAQENPEFLARSIKTVFLVGQTTNVSLEDLLTLEATSFRDIVLGNYRDTYRNLTLKVLHGMHFASQHCKPKFILKTDDDCWVNTEVMLHVIRRHIEQKRLYVGKVTERTEVVRDPQSRWYVPLRQYGPRVYPEYAGGAGYLLSLDAAQIAITGSRHRPPFPNEDAYIGVLMHDAGIVPIFSGRFSANSPGWSPCNFLYLMVLHFVSAKEQMKLEVIARNSRTTCAESEIITSWH